MESAIAGLTVQQLFPQANGTEFEVVRQSRIELLNLRKQRHKIEVLTQELETLQEMYVERVEENMQLKTQNNRINRLIEIYEGEKDEYTIQRHRMLEEIELLKQRAINNTTQMERMYYTIEEMHKLVNEFKRAGGSLFANAENKKDLMEKMNQLQIGVADLTYKLQTSKQQNCNNQSQEFDQLQSELRSEKSAHRSTNERLMVLQRQLDIAKQQNYKLASEKQQKDRINSELKAQLQQLQSQHQQYINKQELATFKKLSTQQIASSKQSALMDSTKKAYIENARNTIAEMKQLEMQKIDQLIDSHSIKSVHPNRNLE